MTLNIFIVNILVALVSQWSLVCGQAGFLEEIMSDPKKGEQKV